MKIYLTGGAGFIGSCVLKRLNDEGYFDITVVDDVNTSEKWKNLLGKRFSNYIHKDDFYKVSNLAKDSVIIHLGACSSTTETDFDYLYKNNVLCSEFLLNEALSKGIKMIYASSAATYGDGKNGFSDKIQLESLRPLNRYGFSKHLFDLSVREKTAGTNALVYGLKFFNVYGPNENHKGSMASMVFHGFNQVNESGNIRLFKSLDPSSLDGEQIRDFVYVKDVSDVILFFLKNSPKSGIYNVGTGEGRSFNDLARSVFSALEKEENIEYFDMPDSLKKQYQSYTVADISSLREVGYRKPFTSLEEGVKDYVQNYLIDGKIY